MICTGALPVLVSSDLYGSLTAGQQCCVRESATTSLLPAPERSGSHALSRLSRLKRVHLLCCVWESATTTYQSSPHAEWSTAGPTSLLPPDQITLTLTGAERIAPSPAPLSPTSQQARSPRTKRTTHALPAGSVSTKTLCHRLGPPEFNAQMS